MAAVIEIENRNKNIQNYELKVCGGKISIESGPLETAYFILFLALPFVISSLLEQDGLTNTKLHLQTTRREYNLFQYD